MALRRSWAVVHSRQPGPDRSGAARMHLPNDVLIQEVDYHLNIAGVIASSSGSTSSRPEVAIAAIIRFRLAAG
jgi:hypothetical protein